MYDLANFNLGTMTECGAALRRLGAGAASMEEVAGRIVRCLYDSFVDPVSNERALALARLFTTLSYADLDEGLRDSARAFLRQEPGGPPARPDMKCLTLLATVGAQAAWNNRTRSAGHRAIPLSSANLVAQSPMIAQLIRQCGFDLGVLLAPGGDLLVDLEQRTYNVFHVPEARGSPFVPAQEDFVLPLGVRSVLGFGGLLPSGQLFAIIIFSRVLIARETANMFAPLALSAKIALLPFAGGVVFSGAASGVAAGPRGHARPMVDEASRLRSRIAALEQLMEVEDRAVLEQSERLQGALAESDRHARMLEISEQALRGKTLELERSNAELEQFAYIASHDLQEPLRIMKTYVELLARRYAGRLDPEADRHLAHLTGNAEQMTTLVKNLLTLSRAGAPGKPPVPVEASSVCDRAIANLQAVIASEMATVTRDPLPAVMGDPIQLMEVFQNLIGNGIKFHGEKPPRVHVSAGLQGGEAVFSVRDEGIGIDPRSLEEIFQMFKRLQPRSRYAGSGIGLAICKRIVERHGGRIWAETEPGRGSTFRFTLPLQEKGHERSEEL
jgi:signal transduction histidine kinase